MKLQLALDLCTVEQASDILSQLHDLIDIAEIGTPMIMRDGVAAVTAIKEWQPNLTVLADLKIVDAGEHEAAIGFAAGADIVTVLGVADDATIRGAVASAKDHGGQVMADLISVADVAPRAGELVALGIDFVCVHTAYDRQASGADPLDDLRLAGGAIGRPKLAVAGGIDAAKAKQLVDQRPAIVVVGGAITGAADRRAAADEIKHALAEPQA